MNEDYKVISEARLKLDNIRCFLRHNESVEVAQAILKGCEVIKQELDKMFLNNEK